MCAIIHHVSPPGPWQPYDGGDFIIWHTNTAAGGDTGHALLLWRKWRQSQVAKNLIPKLHSAIVIPRVHQNTPQSKSYCWKWRKDIENRANFLHRSPSKQCWSLTQLWTWGETAGGWWLLLLNEGYPKVREDSIIMPTSAFIFKILS